MRRLLVLVLLALSAFWVRPGWACSCDAPPTFEEALAAAEVAFVGEVISGEYGGHVDVRVDGVIKGSVRSVVLLRTYGDGNGASCGGRAPSQRPITYAGPADLRAPGCDRTLWAAEQSQGLALRPPRPGMELRPAGVADVLLALVALAALPLVRVPRAEVRRRRADALELQALRLSR